MNRGIYIHIPFCSSKCPYCDFYSIVTTKEVMTRYIDACIKEMQASPLQGSFIDTVYIGGGTPSLLPIKLLKKLIDAIFSNFAVKAQEITIEVNPCSAQNIAAYAELGINRLSIGVQSLNNQVLAGLGRRHTAKEALGVLERASAVYKNISCDLMLAVPYQQEKDIINDINILSDYSAHISAYLLKCEQGTSMYTWIKEGRYTNAIADEEQAADYYLLAVNELAQKGLARYETSNFALPGFESKHNLKYWQGKEYLGIGAGAHSYTQGKRYCIEPDICRYIEQTEAGKDPRILLEELDRQALIKERIMLSLRLAQGLDIAAFAKDFDIDFLSFYKKAIEKCKKLLQIKDNFLALNQQGFLLQNAVIAEFLDISPA